VSDWVNCNIREPAGGPFPGKLWATSDIFSDETLPQQAWVIGRGNKIIHSPE